MGLFDNFLRNDTPAPQQQAAPAPAPAPQQTPTPPGNIPEPQMQGPAGQGTAPETPPVTTRESNAPDSPLAAFEGMWEDVPKSEGEQQPPAPVELSAEELNKAVSNVNFVEGLPQEQAQAIAEGGEAAVAAVTELVNNVARKMLVQSTLVSNKLTNRNIDTAMEAHAQKIPGLLKEQAVNHHLADSDPLFNNPAVKPVIEATKAQLLQHNPTATPEEITRLTRDYIIAMGESFNPQKQEQAPAGTDWSKFLE